MTEQSCIWQGSQITRRTLTESVPVRLAVWANQCHPTRQRRRFLPMQMITEFLLAGYDLATLKSVLPMVSL